MKILNSPRHCCNITVSLHHICCHNASRQAMVIFSRVFSRGSASTHFRCGGILND